MIGNSFCRPVCLLSAVYSLLAFAGCREQVNLKDVEVVCRRYEGQSMRPISPESRYLKMADRWRESLDGRSRELGRTAMKCPSVENVLPNSLAYEYHTAWDDTATGNVILYYFAPIHEPKVYAGYGIHAVVGIREGRLKQICVFPVPLE